MDVVSGPGDPKAYVDSAVVLPRGRLSINVEAWSDQRADGPAPRPLGMYAATDWSHPMSVGMGPPFDVATNRSVLNMLDVVTTATSVTYYSLDPSQQGVFMSRDGGRHWRLVRAR